VTGAPGKLCVSFPAAPRLSFPSDPATIHAITALIAELDATEFSDAMPTSKKAGTVQTEIRETTDPRYVTELLGGIARAFTDDVQAVAETTVYVTKRVADRVLWKNALLPWRRSPKWLIIRVALQTTFQALQAESICSYKMFLAYLLAVVLNEGRSRQIAPHLLSFMSAKIARRVYKIQDVVSAHEGSSVVSFIVTALKSTRVHLDALAACVHEEQAVPLAWTAPSSKELKIAQELTLVNSRSFLHAAHRRLAQLEAVDDVFDSVAFENTLIAKYRSITASTIPPKLLEDGSFEDRLLSLIAVERWVVEDMSAWSRSPQYSTSKLVNMIRVHIRATFKSYKSNPELFSRSLIMILEMWVILDQQAVDNIPLLSSYSPEISPDLLSPLILPSLAQMRRLHAIEQYLQSRHTASIHGSAIYNRFPGGHSFAVCYFNSSPALGILRNKIIREAERKRDEKLRELKEKNNELQRLRDRVATMSCSYQTQVDRRGNVKQSHRNPCSRCDILKKATRMKIEVFEWPLPEEENASKAVVFELQPPSIYAAWRSVIHALLDAMSPSPTKSQKAEVKVHLGGYVSLRSHLRQPQDGSELSLASSTKSFLGSHYKMKSVASEDSVIKRHPLDLQLFDKSSQAWLQCPSPELRKLCSYQLPDGPYRPLQWALCSTMHTSNEIIASQSSCPRELSLHEWDSFAHIRSGHRLQWRNILLQLLTAECTLSDSAVYVLVAQSAWQAETRNNSSPQYDGHVWREAHIELRDPDFCTQILKALQNRWRMIADNWQEGMSEYLHDSPL
jgi:hypothetical protein